MKLFTLYLLLIVCLGCTDTYKKNTELINFVPKNTAVIIKSTNHESLKRNIENNDFLKQISKTDTYIGLKEKLTPLNHLKPNNEILICFSNNKNDSLQYTAITKLSANIFATDSLVNYTTETLPYKNKSITKSKFNNNILFSTVIDSTFLISSSEKIIKNALIKRNNDVTLNKIYKTINPNQTCALILKPKNFESSLLLNDSLSLNNLTEYIALDINLAQNDITFNGITKATDSTKSLINVFKNTKPQINQIQNITPSNSDGFMSFTFHNFKTLHNNLLKINKKDSLPVLQSLFNDITEVGIIYKDDKKAIILNSIDVIATKDALLSEQNLLEKYREVELYSFSQHKIFAKTFTPLLRFNNANAYCVLDNYFVFSENLDVLKNIITNYQNKTTINHTDYFKATQEKISDASSLLQVVKAPLLQRICNNNLAMQDYSASAIQFIYDTDFAHVNGTLRKDTKKTPIHSVTEAFAVKLDYAILGAPQLVKNHTTKQKDIMVQDVNNSLYLISNTGKVIWTKQLEAPILGNIKQVDRYKNGQLQFVFATKNKVYMLSKNGKNESPFPLKFNDDITQPLAVFDYDANKKYRFLVTQGKNALMYGAKGQAIRGFKFKLAKSPITTLPKHHRIGNKDYITLKTEKKLFILDRLGKIRVQPKKKFAYSNQPIFLHNNTFTTTTATGDLIAIDEKGNVTSKKLNLSAKHDIKSTGKTLITQSENKLTIKNTTTTLDFGEYTSPRHFYINNKIYISTTDLQSHKVYLYDSNSKLLPNFPIYGNSAIMLDNIDTDNNLEFVTQGAAKEVILYQIN